MKNRVYLITLSILVVALGLYIVFRDTNKIQYQLPEVEPFQKDRITEITYKKGDRTVTLRKDQETWTIQPDGFPADSSKVGRLVDAVAGVAPVDLVSDKKAYEKYSLNEQERIEVTVFGDEEQLTSFYLGKESSSGRYTYMKLPDDPNIYSAQGSLKRNFLFDESALRDKQVLSFNAEDITRIVFEDDETTVLTKLLAENDAAPEEENGSGGDAPAESAPARDDFVWKDEEGTIIENQKIDEWLKRAALLKCKNFDSRPQNAEIIGVVTLTDVSDNRYTLTLYEKDENGYPATSSMTDYQFYLSPYIGETILELFP